MLLIQGYGQGVHLFLTLIFSVYMFRLCVAWTIFLAGYILSDSVIIFYRFNREFIGTNAINNGHMVVIGEVKL